VIKSTSFSRRLFEGMFADAKK